MEGGKAMRKLWQILGFSVLVAASVAQTLNDSRLTYDTIISSGLSRPIMMTWLNPANPNDFFVLEKVAGSSSPRVGRVRRVTNGVISEPLLTLEVSSANWEHGLLGIELHPDFEQNGYVYLYYTEPDPAAPTVSLRSRLVRYRFNGTALIEPIDIWTVPIRNA
jgi:glucose/arabinose dehydrogenase